MDWLKRMRVFFMSNSLFSFDEEAIQVSNAKMKNTETRIVKIRHSRCTATKRSCAAGDLISLLISGFTLCA